MRPARRFMLERYCFSLFYCPSVIISPQYYCWAEDDFLAKAFNCASLTRQELRHSRIQSTILWLVTLIFIACWPAICFSNLFGSLTDNEPMQMRTFPKMFKYLSQALITILYYHYRISKESLHRSIRFNSWNKCVQTGLIDTEMFPIRII